VREFALRLYLQTYPGLGSDVHSPFLMDNIVSFLAIFPSLCMYKALCTPCACTRRGKWAKNDTILISKICECAPNPKVGYVYNYNEDVNSCPCPLYPSSSCVPRCVAHKAWHKPCASLVQGKNRYSQKKMVIFQEKKILISLTGWIFFCFRGSEPLLMAQDNGKLTIYPITSFKNMFPPTTVFCTRAAHPVYFLGFTVIKCCTRP